MLIRSFQYKDKEGNESATTVFEKSALASAPFPLKMNSIFTDILIG